MGALPAPGGMMQPPLAPIIARRPLPRMHRRIAALTMPLTLQQE